MHFLLEAVASGSQDTLLKCILAQRRSLVVECLPCTSEALGLICSSKKKRMKKEINVKCAQVMCYLLR